MFAVILMLGSFVWVLSELTELTQGSYTALNSAISAMAFALIAAGIFAIWPKVGKNMMGRAGLILISIGMWMFTLIAVLVIGSSITSDAQIAQSTIFLIAGTAVTLGALALGFWIYSEGDFPKWIGIALLVVTIFSIGVAFVPALTPLQSFANLCLTALLFWLGFSMRILSQKPKTDPT